MAKTAALGIINEHFKIPKIATKLLKWPKQVLAIA